MSVSGGAGGREGVIWLEQWECLFHLGAPCCPSKQRVLWVLEPPGDQSRGVWVERFIDQGAGAAEWWELGEGLALWAWLFEKGIVLLLLTKPQPPVQDLAGNLQLSWLTGSFVSQAPQCFSFQLARHLGTAPMPYWVEANSSNHALSLQYAEHRSCTISICDHLCNDPMQ